MKTIFLESFEREIITLLFITRTSLMLDLMANNVPDGCNRSIYTIAGMRNTGITITTKHRSHLITLRYDLGYDELIF